MFSADFKSTYTFQPKIIKVKLFREKFQVK